MTHVGQGILPALGASTSSAVDFRATWDYRRTARQQPSSSRQNDVHMPLKPWAYHRFVILAWWRLARWRAFRRLLRSHWLQRRPRLLMKIAYILLTGSDRRRAAGALRMLLISRYLNSYRS